MREGEAAKKEYFFQLTSMVGNWSSSLGKTLGNSMQKKKKKKYQVLIIPSEVQEGWL